MPLGKEIYLFFGTYGTNGILGIILSSCFMGFVIYFVLSLAKKKEIEQYEELSKQLHSNSKIREIIKGIMEVFLLISFYIMIAGFSAYFSQEFGFPKIVGGSIILILSYLTYMGNMERLIKINTFLIPILIISIVFLSIQNKMTFFTSAEHENIFSSIISAILYASYNSIILIPILLSLHKKLKNTKQIKLVGIFCTLILIILSLCILGLIGKITIDIHTIELPTIYVASTMGKIYQYLYGIIILVAIYTSAVSAGYGILENYATQRKKYKRIALYMCISAPFVSQIGFSTLINLLYPVFGLLGLIQILILLKKKENY